MLLRHLAQSGVRPRAQCAPGCPEPSSRYETAPGFSPPATQRRVRHLATRRRRQFRSSTPPAFPVQPNSLHSRLPAGHSARPLPSGAWSPERKHVPHRVASVSTATDRAELPDRALWSAHPATALRDDATTPLPTPPAAAFRRRTSLQALWLGRPAPHAPEFLPHVS